MLVTKVTPIKGHRIFRDFDWPISLATFARYNLIYGWNGTGKSTLSGLFQALERREAVTDGDMVFHIDGNAVRGRHLAPGLPLPDVRVFNRSFVDSTVFRSGSEGVSPIYYLGEDSTKNQQEIEEFKAQLDHENGPNRRLEQATRDRDRARRELAEFCVRSAKSLKDLLRSNDPSVYNDYDKAKFKLRLEQFANKSPQERDAAKLSSSSFDELMARKNATARDPVAELSLTFPDVPELTRQVAHLVGSVVRNQALEILASDAALNAWVREGLRLHHLIDGSSSTEAARCAFCEGPLAEDRVIALRAHFNDEYARFLAAASSLEGKLQVARRDISSARPPRTGELADPLRPKFESLLELFERTRASYDGYLEQLQSAVQRKRERPFEALRLDSIVDLQAPDAVGAQQAVKELGVLVHQHNIEAASFQDLVRGARRGLEEGEFAQCVVEYMQRKSAPDEYEQLRQEAEAERRAILDQIATRERVVAGHHRPAEELNEELAAYLGRRELEFSPRGNGYAILRGGQVATNISEGEKTAMAFLYFLKSLKGSNFDLANGVVVIDDPVSSLDANSLFCAFGYMQKRTVEAEQLFILTHNFAFFRQAKRWFSYLEQKKLQTAYFMLDCVQVDGARSSRLVPLDPLLKNYHSEYHFLFNKVLDGAEADAGRPLETYYGLPNIARRLVEVFLAFRHPGGKTAYARLAAANVDPAQSVRIDRFINTYSHEEGAGDEIDATQLAEAPQIMRAILRLIRAEDRGHYEEMCELCGRSPQQARALVE